MHKQLPLALGISFVLILCVLSGPAFAESPENDEITRRIDFIQSRLDTGTKSAKRWQYSWMAINTASTAAQFGLAVSQSDEDEKDDRYDNLVGGITNFFAVGDLIFNPLTAWNAADKLRTMPEANDKDKKEKLQYAENLLKECADREEYGRSWVNHALNGLVCLAGGVAIACDGGRGGDGAVFFATSMAVAEIQIFTMPTKAIADWQSYSSMSSEEFAVRPHKPYQKQIYLSAQPEGIFCTILF